MINLILHYAEFNKIETDKDIVIQQLNPEGAISLYNKVNIYPHWETRSINNYYNLITPYSVSLDGEVIGYFDMWVNHVSSIALKPDLIGSGIGKLFVSSVFEHGLNEFKHLRLSTDPNIDNPHAIKVYEALGCKIIK